MADKPSKAVDLLSKHLDECEKCHSHQPCVWGEWLTLHLTREGVEAIVTAMPPAHPV